MQSTVTSASLSFFGYAEWVAVITAFATAATSWVEFHGFVKKLDSYTSTVRSLETHLSWWKSLSDSAKATTSANDRLVEMGEQYILATRFSRSLMHQEKVKDVGAEGTASGKADTVREAVTETSQPEASQPQASPSQASQQASG